MLARAIGARLTHVPYRGAAPAVQDLVGGRLPLFVGVLGDISPQQGQGARMLAVTSTTRNPRYPDVPTVSELGHPARPIFDLLLRYAVSEDGALHAEKYYRTVTEEFVSTRPAFRWRQLVALARVTASEYGRPAPGIAEARSLLGLTV